MMMVVVKMVFTDSFSRLFHFACHQPTNQPLTTNKQTQKQQQQRRKQQRRSNCKGFVTIVNGRLVDESPFMPPILHTTDFKEYQWVL